MKPHIKPITVSELIEQLNQLDPNAYIGVYGEDRFLDLAETVRQFDCPFNLRHAEDNDRQIVAIHVKTIQEKLG